ncbi:RNA polymerase sigma-70 factor (ECF subfamily) [Mucilaginibacter gracilis]|uniref:RNA polymerase sigma-70 factor (ECF subfamily) n=1 Tax=Mucilaginibacter gracilis TaxID=423350 RepID=A0A495J3Z5_9SPHI|nr:sigma-70 family RNA polymerase sigma factor [Mucilaginibacter gracilis]RKR83401.1 RNA polymerase sigma-70 factor (ECF subfamily) [Mucilaginibacter gracilis]
MTENIQTDEELWQLIKQDSHTAFETLYLRYLKSVFTEINKRISDRDQAEDLTQEVFLSLWEKRVTSNPQGAIYPYIYGIAINKVFNYFRSNKIPANFIETWETLPEDLAQLAELPQAFKVAEVTEMEHLLEEERSNLPEKMRRVYELRYEKRLSIAEIADGLSISHNTVHNHLKEVRKRFTSALRKSSFLL